MDGKKILLEIDSPQNPLMKGYVDKVVLPGVCGSFAVLYNHASLITSLEAGEIRYTSDGKEIGIRISSGFVEVRKNKVMVCVEE